MLVLHTQYRQEASNSNLRNRSNDLKVVAFHVSEKDTGSRDVKQTSAEALLKLGTRSEICKNRAHSPIVQRSHLHEVDIDLVKAYSR